MNTATWINLIYIPGLILAEIFFVLLLLTDFYEPAKKKVRKITVYAMTGLIALEFLVVICGMFFVVE